MYELKTLNNMLALIDRLVGNIRIKKWQSTIISLAVFGMMMTAFSKFSFFTDKLSYYGISPRMMSVASSGLFFVFLILIFISLAKNTDIEVKFNAWLGIPLLLIVVSYIITGIVEKAPKQIIWAFVYSFVFVPISYRLVNRDNRKILVDCKIKLNI